MHVLIEMIERSIPNIFTVDSLLETTLAGYYQHASEPSFILYYDGGTGFILYDRSTPTSCQPFSAGDSKEFDDITDLPNSVWIQIVDHVRVTHGHAG